MEKRIQQIRQDDSPRIIQYNQGRRNVSTALKNGIRTTVAAGSYSVRKLLCPECPETVAQQADTGTVSGNLMKHFEGAAVDGFELRVVDDKDPENDKPQCRREQKERVQAAAEDYREPGGEKTSCHTEAENADAGKCYGKRYMMFRFVFPCGKEQVIEVAQVVPAPGAAGVEIEHPDMPRFGGGDVGERYGGNEQDREENDRPVTEGVGDFSPERQGQYRAEDGGCGGNRKCEKIELKIFYIVDIKEWSGDRHGSLYQRGGETVKNESPCLRKQLGEFPARPLCGNWWFVLSRDHDTGEYTGNACRNEDCGKQQPDCRIRGIPAGDVPCGKHTEQL